MGVSVALPALFSDPTIQGLGKAIREGGQVQSIPLVPRPQRDFKVSFPQQRLWFIDRLQGGSPEYNMPGAFAFEGDVDIALLGRVFGEIVSRHEVLRTVYEEREGEVYQRVRSPDDVSLSRLPSLCPSLALTFFAKKNKGSSKLATANASWEYILKTWRWRQKLVDGSIDSFFFH